MSREPVADLAPADVEDAHVAALTAGDQQLGTQGGRVEVRSRNMRERGIWGQQLKRAGLHVGVGR